MMKAVLIGDSIRMGYEPTVREALDGVVEVISPRENGGTSTKVLEHFDAWIASAQPDLVHLNAGLHDLARESANGGKPRTTLDDYKQNLETLFTRIHDDIGARIIWARITPVNEAWHRQNKSFDRLEADVENYNRVADAVARAHNVVLNDLYTTVMEAGRDSLLTPDGVHFSPDGYALLGQQVARAIRGAPG